MRTMPIPSSDAEYQASSDYDALVQAEIVKVDKKRHKAAMAWGEKLKEAREAEARAMEALAEDSEYT